MAKAKPTTNLEAARSGDIRLALEMARDSLAAAMDVVEEQMLPQVVGQYRAILRDLADLPGEAKATVADDLRARREARRAEAQTPAPTPRARKQRGSGSD